MYGVRVCSSSVKVYSLEVSLKGAKSGSSRSRLQRVVVSFRRCSADVNQVTLSIANID